MWRARRWCTAGNTLRTAWSTSSASFAHMTLARSDRHSTVGAARRLRTASNTPRMAWLTFAASIASMVPAQNNRCTVLRAARQRCAASSMARTAWSTSSTSFARMTPVLRSRSLMRLEEKRQFTASNYKQHAGEGMVNVRSQLCFINSCLRRRIYAVEGSKTPVSCQHYAEEGRRKLCSRHSCTKSPSFHVVGSRTMAYCTPHAETGMVSIRTWRPFGDPCMAGPAQGFQTSASATECTRPNIIVTGDSVRKC